MKHETKTGRKLLSVLLALAMVIGLLPGMGLTVHADQVQCPECGSTNVEQIYGNQYKCNDCFGWFEYTPSGPPDPSDTVEGDGSEYNPYMVGSCNALVSLCNSFRDEWYEDYAPYVQLKANIEFNNSIMTLGYGINLNLDTYHIDCGEMETRFESGTFTVTGGTGSYISKVSIQEGATVTLNSGTIKDVTVDNSTLVINGGSITEDFETDNHAVIEMNNGTACEIDVDDTSEFTMTGGTVENFIHLNGQSTSVISGGTIPGLTLYGSAVCEVSGGTFTAVSTVVNGGTLTVSGGDFSGQYGGILNYGGAVEVTGGTFGSVANTSGTMALKGGNYEKRPSYYDIDEQTYLETYVPNGYNVEETTNYFTVVSVPVHTIIWKNWDGTTLETDTEIEEGATPTYDGEEPTKAEDDTNTYTFSGWNPTVSAVTGEATYVAQFTATPKATAYADYVPAEADDADALAAKVVKFNGYDWYLIEDNSTSETEGTVTLLSANDQFGYSMFSETDQLYSNSEVKAKLDAITAEGGDFADVADAIVATDLTDVSVTGAKLYLLSVSEAKNLSAAVRAYSFLQSDVLEGAWWLRSINEYNGYNDSFVYGTGEISEDGWSPMYSENGDLSLGVRPALKLDLSKVAFNSETKTFAVPTPPHTHDDITFTAWTSADSLPSESGSYYLTRDVVISDSWKIEGTYDNHKTINLCLNGYGIRYSGDNGPAVNVYREATLNLYDCNTTRNHYVTLTDGRGTAVSDTPVDGAVAVAGGYITGGLADGSAAGTSRKGGGVSIDRTCSFNMYGGTIIGNKAWQGGGVNVGDETSFNMYGGVITRNTAFAGALGKGVGGGLCIQSETHMYGGSITDNTAATGGGVGFDGNYGFYLHGGEITGNTASSQGGGVYVPALEGSGGLYLSGSPVITGNTKGDDANNLYVIGKVQVKEPMSTGANIGVTLPGGIGTFASGEPVYENNTYTTYFTSDNPAYSVVVDGFSLNLAAHEHSFTYGAEGTVLTATCTDTVGTCSLTDSKVTLTIAAPTLTTYGQSGQGISAEATLEGWEAFIAATGQTATATDIRYVGRQETTYGESATAPTTPGKYTARITVAGATASVNYEIGRATPTVDDFTFTASNQIYDGNPKSASVMVEEGVTGMGNVTVQYYSDDACTTPATPTDVGTYYVGVTTIGDSNYKATEAVLHGENWQFTIMKAQAAAEDFVFIPPNATTYDGTTKNATVTPKQGITGMGSVSVQYYSDADYMQSVENPTNVGTYYVVVTVTEGDNYYPPMLGVRDPSWYFTIIKADPNADDFTYTAPDDLTYDGNPKAATVNVNDGVNGMGQATVKYYSDAQRTIPATPTDVGTYYVGITVDGGSNYNSAVLYDAAWQFTIGKTNPAAENFTFAPPANLTYDGNPKSASVTAKDGVNGMGQATVKYYSDAACTTEANPVNVGTYYVGITVGDGSNYNAAATVISHPNWRFSITKAAPKAEHFTCSTPTDLVYDGTEKSVATVTVKDGINGMGDVTVKYYSDAARTTEVTPTDAGTYYVGITVAEGTNYNAATSALYGALWQFTITKAAPAAEDFDYATPTDLTYDGNAKTATVTAREGVNGMGDVTVQYYSDAQRTIPATPTDAGTYYVGITVTAGTNYSAATSALYGEAWQFTISRIDPIADDFDCATPTDLTYDGSAKSATVTAKEGVNGMGDVTVQYYSDAACENEVEPTDAGTYYVGITVAQGKNYNATDTDLRDPSWQFTISKIAPVTDDFDYATPTDLTYDGTAKSVPVTARDGVNGMGDVTVNYYSDAQRTTPATPTDAGTYYVGITVAQGKNYNATDTDLHDEGWQFTIAKADITPTVSMKNWTEGYRASEPVLAGNPGEGDVTFTYAKQGKDDFTEKKPTSAGRYIVKATVAETANYNGGEATAQFTINADDSGKLTVTSPLTSVSRVTLNGRVVSPSNYIVVGGDVQFTDAFLATLKPGTYTIKVTDGTKTATATYRIAANGVAESTVLSATTGDPGVVLYGLLAVSSTLGLAWMGKKRKED